MPLSFAEILKDAPPRPAPPAVAKPPSRSPEAPPSASPVPDTRYARYESEKRLLDDVLKEVITEISQEIQRIGTALAAPPGAPSHAGISPDAGDPGRPPGRLLEEILTAEERKALSDILRETPPRISLAPPDVAMDDDLPMGGFDIPGSRKDDPPSRDETGGLDALMAMHGSTATSPLMPGPAPGAPIGPAASALPPVEGGSGVWVSAPAVQQALHANAESDAGIMEVEDMIKMHMATYVEESKKEKEDEDKAGRAAAAAAGAELLAMVKPKSPSPLARFDAWVVARGWARHKRRVGIVAWAILLGTMIGVVVTVWMRM